MTFPVVSADSDHRLLSLQPFGLRQVSQLYSYLCEPWGNGQCMLKPLSGDREVTRAELTTPINVAPRDLLLWKVRTLSAAPQLGYGGNSYGL
jgi:hypothetical protein